METNEKKAFLEELQKTPEIYVIMSVCTKMPYVYCEPESYDDQVFLFHKEEDAKKLVEDYRQHENPIVAVKLENKQFLGFYSSLFMMGVNGLNIDFGTDEAQSIQLTDLVRRPDYSKLPEGKVKVENPELELTTIYYMQEIRRKPGIGQQPRFRELEDEMLTHFREGTFIVPVQTADKENGETESKVPFMKMKNGDIYQPIFTDMPEFFKFCRDGKFRAAVIPYEKLNAVILKQAKGIIMKPFGVRLILNKGQF